MSAANFYTGIVADVYTSLRSTTFDAAPYLEFVDRAGQPALELGCGADGPFLAQARRGIDVDGVDSSPDMLARCHVRAEAEGLHIDTYCQRMEDLDLARSYRAIYLAGPTFNLLPDDDTALRALRRITEHLQQDGQVMVPLWIPQATPHEELGRTREARTADGATARYTVESEDYDQTTRIRRTRTRYELLRDDRREQLRRDWIIHWHTPDSLGALAQAAGLQIAGITPIVDGEYIVTLRLA